MSSQLTAAISRIQCSTLALDQAPPRWMSKHQMRPTCTHNKPFASDDDSIYSLSTYAGNALETSFS